MHIPAGYISPSTSAVAFVAVAPFWMVAARHARQSLKGTAVPRLGLFAAFSFVIMMFNLPLPGGTTGHAVGGALMALTLGPWMAVLGVSAALAIQALFFGDGGILELGANCLNLGVVLPFVAWGSYRSLRRARVPEGWAAGLGGWAGLMAAAATTALMLGIQPLLFRGPDGAPLYCPYGLKTALWAMLPPHALVAAPIEGLVTALVWNYLRRVDPSRHAAAEPQGAFPLKPLAIGLAILALLTPVGLLAPGTAWAEWAGEELPAMVGFLPRNLAALEQSRLPAWMPDYAIPGMGERSGYILAAFLGIALVAGAVWLLLALMRMGRAPASDEPTGSR